MELVFDVEANIGEKILAMFDLSNAAKELINKEGVFEKWVDGYADPREIIKLEEFRPKFENDEVGNFVYLRRAGIVFNTLGHAHHANFMGGLYVLNRLANGEFPDGDGSINCVENYEGKMKLNRLGDWVFREGESKWDNQDKYLKTEMGVYQSSCGRIFYRHEKFQPNAVEFNQFYNASEWRVYDF